MKVTNEMITLFEQHGTSGYGDITDTRAGLQAVLDLIEGKVIAALDAIDSDDPEKAHGDAEVAIISAFANQESESFSNKVGEAWDRAADRVGGFWYA